MICGTRLQASRNGFVWYGTCLRDHGHAGPHRALVFATGVGVWADGDNVVEWEVPA